MESIHSERDLIKFIKIATGVELSGNEDNYKMAMKWLNDPRRGYSLIKTPESALYWLSLGNYSVANFSGGLGLCDNRVGGCWGYFEDGLLEEMANNELISFDATRARFGGILSKGYKILSKETA